MDKLGLEPAFPVDGIYAADAFRGNNTGISKRLYIATKIATAFVSRDYKNTELMVKNSYAIADELLKQENDV